MKWLVLLAALVMPMPTHATGVTVPGDLGHNLMTGAVCEGCHGEFSQLSGGTFKMQELTAAQAEAKLRQFGLPLSLLDPDKDGDTDIFGWYGSLPTPPPQTPLPGALWLLAAPLLWLGHKALKG